MSVYDKAYLGPLINTSSDFIAHQVPIIIECCKQAQRDIDALSNATSYYEKMLYLIEQERLGLYIRRLNELKDCLNFIVQFEKYVG
jgi:hypothetical protein